MQHLLTILLFFTIVSCSKSVEKPAVTIGLHSKQTFQINEVVNKLMNEPDVKVMKLMAEGVEATRAISCDAVGEECNVYYEFINKVVDLTADGDLSIKDRELLESIKRRMKIEIEKSNLKIQKEWKEYINAESRGN